MPRRKKLRQKQKQKQRIKINIKNVLSSSAGGGSGGGGMYYPPPQQIVRDFTRPVWMGENPLPPPPRAPKLPKGRPVNPPDEIPPQDVNMGSAEQIPEPPVILPPPAAPAQGIAARSEPAKPLAGIMKPPPFPKKVYVSGEGRSPAGVGIQKMGRTTHHPFPWPPMQEDYKPPPAEARLQPLARAQFLPGGGSMQGAEPPPPRNIKMKEFAGPSRVQLPQPTPKPGDIQLGVEESKATEPITKPIIEKGRRVPQPQLTLASSLPRLNVADPSDRSNIPRLSLVDVPGRVPSAPLPSVGGAGIIPPRRGEPKPAMKIPKMVPVVTPLVSNITSSRALPAEVGVEESKQEAIVPARPVETNPLALIPRQVSLKRRAPPEEIGVEQAIVPARPVETNPLALIPRSVSLKRARKGGWGEPSPFAVPWEAPPLPSQQIGPLEAPGNPLTNPLAFVPRQVTLSKPPRLAPGSYDEVD